MKIYMAPLEEVTEYIYRNAYHAFFSPMDKYFAPFIAAKQNKGRLFNYKEKKNILPENNQGLYLVPQILTNNSEDFLRTVKGLEEYGYTEVNLNLGCPSRPVVNGGRGSGFLDKREALDRFLNEIFEGENICKNAGRQIRTGRDWAFNGYFLSVSFGRTDYTSASTAGFL